MDIGDLIFHDGTRNTADLSKMLEKLGKEETIRRFAWLYSTKIEVVSNLLEQYLSGDYVDDEGIKGGKSFWGDL